MSTPDPFYDRRESVVVASNNVPYVIAVVAMVALGVLAVVAITIVRPDQENTALLATVIGFIAPTTFSLLAFMKSAETHQSVNGRLDALLAHARQAAHEQGMAEGRAEGRRAANARTDELARKGHDQ